VSVLWRINLESDTDWQEASERARTRALKAAMLAMASTWKEQMLPRHFQPGASTLYGYQPRKPSYLKRKARAGSTARNSYGRSRASFTGVAGGGALDLVYTGLLRRRILAGSTVRGYPTRATVSLRGPEYFTLRPRNPERPNLAREILTIADRERATLRAAAETTFFRVLAERRRRGRPRSLPH
jgi:hypothetical protein